MVLGDLARDSRGVDIASSAKNYPDVSDPLVTESPGMPKWPSVGQAKRLHQITDEWSVG